jgi:hypothetical protein
MDVDRLYWFLTGVALPLAAAIFFALCLVAPFAPDLGTDVAGLFAATFLGEDCFGAVFWDCANAPPSAAHNRTPGKASQEICIKPTK